MVNTLHWNDNLRTIYNGDARVMIEIPDESVQCVVTSPPYWSLRKYDDVVDLIWDEDSQCRHKWVTETRAGMTGGTNVKAIGGWAGGGVGQNTTFKKITTYRCYCCGAWKGQYGLEPTVEMYVDHTLEILREIRRVLKKDGVVFWNIGDSYMNMSGSNDQQSGVGQRYKGDRIKRLPTNVIKTKNMSLIPFRVAIAAQEDGWWIRSVIIWSKPNSMPESVKDRPTTSHEYILMMTKRRRYYWNHESVRQPLAAGSWERSQRSEKTAHSESRIRNKGTGEHGRAKLAGSQIRSVWQFPTKPSSEKHYAAFPPKLPELCIKAASKEGDLVLDPFMGTGTTLKMAAYLNRPSIGYEISPYYCAIAVKLNRQGVFDWRI